MKKRVFSGTRPAFALESLEHREMLYAAGMPDLVGLTGTNGIRTNYPTLRGQGQVVVVMDTGVNGINYGGGNFVHPAFTNSDGSSKIWTNPNPLAAEVHGWNYYANTADAQDINGHGTAIASVIAANPFTFDEDGGGAAPTGSYQGVAPDAKILPIKLYEVTSNVAHWASKTNLHAAFKWVYDHATEYNIASINMSWGFFGANRSAADANPSLDDYNYTPAGGFSIKDYIDKLRNEKNVLIVQAAGNGDKDDSANPGSEAGETAVSSLNIDGSTIWGDDAQFEVQDGGAAYGRDTDFVDILAPGWNVTANGWNTGYTLQPGYTSFATPWIAGAAALLKQINPAITPDQIIARATTPVTEMPDTWAKAGLSPVIRSS
jgi:subtilisin family serine protease